MAYETLYSIVSCKTWYFTPLKPRISRMICLAIVEFSNVQQKIENEFWLSWFSGILHCSGKREIPEKPGKSRKQISCTFLAFRDYYRLVASVTRAPRYFSTRGIGNSYFSLTCAIFIALIALIVRSGESTFTTL